MKKLQDAYFADAERQHQLQFTTQCCTAIVLVKCHNIAHALGSMGMHTCHQSSHALPRVPDHQKVSSNAPSYSMPPYGRHCPSLHSTPEKKDKTMPFGTILMRTQVSYRAAQDSTAALIHLCDTLRLMMHQQGGNINLQCCDAASGYSCMLLEHDTYSTESVVSFHIEIFLCSM